jgi:hypothetical protein
MNKEELFNSENRVKFAVYDAFATSTACVVANLVTHPLDTLKGILIY